MKVDHGILLVAILMMLLAGFIGGDKLIIITHIWLAAYWIRQ